MRNEKLEAEISSFFVPRSSFFVHRSSRSRGLSLIEVLIALAITALLMAATMAATHASFRAYADAVEREEGLLRIEVQTATALAPEVRPLARAWCSSRPGPRRCRFDRAASIPW
jgi:prepilin-type N-terminal cleavage/methylation domain-containing protein